MSEIEKSLLLHRKVLHWLIGAACLKNKLSQKYPPSSSQLISSNSITSDLSFKTH